MVSFIGDITVISPPERSPNITAVGKVNECLQERLGGEGISLNRNKAQALQANGVPPDDFTEEQCLARNGIELIVVEQGTRVVGREVKTEQPKRDYVK